MAEPRTWYVLLHSPGPAVPDGQSVFEHPGMAEHFGFLQRQAEAGRLIAAGPLADTGGDGMTVIEAASIEQARQLAEQDDQSVVSGVLTVTVRPWQVMLAPVVDR